MVQVPNLSIYRSIKVLLASFPLPWSCSHFLITFESRGGKIVGVQCKSHTKASAIPVLHYTEVVRKETACEYLYSFRKFWIIQMIYHESHPRVYHSCPDNSCTDRGRALWAPRNRCMHQLKMAVCVYSRLSRLEIKLEADWGPGSCSSPISPFCPASVAKD